MVAVIGTTSSFGVMGEPVGYPKSQSSTNMESPTQISFASPQYRLSGIMVGAKVGSAEGRFVGSLVGEELSDGFEIEAGAGCVDGDTVGGDSEGWELFDGGVLGLIDGITDGGPVWGLLGLVDGCTDGGKLLDGPGDGAALGMVETLGAGVMRRCPTGLGAKAVPMRKPRNK